MIYTPNLDEAKLKEMSYNFLSSIASNNKVLGNEAVWLFVATLGCYSVKDMYLRMFAMVLVMGFYGLIVDEKRVSKTTYAETNSSILLHIEHSTLSSSKKIEVSQELNVRTKKLLSLSA